MSTASLESSGRNENLNENHSFENAENSNSTLQTVTTPTNDTTMTPIQPPVEPVTPDRLTPNNRTGFKSYSTDPFFSIVRGQLIRQSYVQPFNLARILMQIGYEPLGADKGRIIFCQEALFYPNIFKYLKYIYREEGFLGFYRGFGCAVASNVVRSYTVTKFDELFISNLKQSNNEDAKSQWNACVDITLRRVLSNSWGLLVSHPFQVMFVRSVGQFIGKENIYSSYNIFQNIQEIYAREGIGGFFVGLIPRWLMETAAIVLTNILIQIIRMNLSSYKEIASAAEGASDLAVQSLVYPWGLTSSLIMINRSGLQAARLPSIPPCTDWQDTYKYLSQTQQTKRGSSFFFRKASPIYANSITSSRLS